MIRLMLGFVAAATVAGSALAQPAVERGSYLVNTIMTCGNCHSPKGPPAAVAGKDFSGGLSWDEPPFKVTAPNITQDKETGIGNWTDDQIKTMLLTGKNPHGIQEAEVMPTAFYPILTPGDLNSIVAYLRTLKPVKQQGARPDLQDRAAAPCVPRRREVLFAGRSQRQAEARLLPRHHRPLHGMPHAVRGGRRAARFRRLAGQGRRRIPRALGRGEVAQHHLEQDRRHRRLDRRRDQGSDRSRQAEGRHARSTGRWASSTTSR